MCVGEGVGVDDERSSQNKKIERTEVMKRKGLTVGEGRNCGRERREGTGFNEDIQCI